MAKDSRTEPTVAAAAEAFRVIVVFRARLRVLGLLRLFFGFYKQPGRR
jgi:hypothetical protein